MKKYQYLFFAALMFSMGCEKNGKIDLKIGLIDEGAHMYYQEYDAGLGNKTIEGYIDLSSLSEKTNSEGYPIASLTVSVGKSYLDDNDEWVYEETDMLSDMWSLAMNIETGYYAIKGLPDIEENTKIHLKVDDVHWNPPTHERYTIWKDYHSDQWNNKDTYKMPQASFLFEDPSISMTVSFRYMVDTYWLENGEFEDENGPSYTEMDYSQLSSVATLSVEDWVTGIGVSRIEESGLEYNVTTQLSMDDLQSQKVTFAGFSGGEYNRVDVFVLVNGSRHAGTNGTSFTLKAGDNRSSSVDVKIPTD
jgi:hypothetical protein